MKDIVNGAIIGGITGAVGNGTQAAFQTFVETKGDVSATLTSFGKGALSGAAFGGIGGGILGGLTSNFCFVEGTLVLTRFGNKAIEDIQVGDYVLSADPETGDIAYKQVLNTFVNEADTLTHVTVDGETFTSTATHKIYVVDKGWISAGDLEEGDTLMDSQGNKVYVESVETEVLENKITVYNFEVEDYHTYFVGSGVLVHNRGCDKWNKGSFETAEESLEYHYLKHGDEVGANDIEQYARKAEEFAKTAKKGSTKKSIDGAVEGVMRYVKNGKYIDLAPDGSIVSFGKK